jgi:HAD superfamily hydrolase (TIGR01509 family)
VDSLARAISIGPVATPRIEAVLFDLGGVLAEQAVTASMRDLAGLESDDQVVERWLACSWVRRFESGRCTATQFATGVVEDWSLGISAEEFLDSFRGWAVAPFPGSLELVRATKAHARVGCLSNMNVLHWEDRVSSWGLAELFEFPILSFRLGLIKPDRKIFERAIDTVGCPPGQILFLDDSAINVQAARSAGIASARVRGVEESREALTQNGVLLTH